MIKLFEKLIFLLLIFSIPFQTRVFLWSAGIVEGFNEWQSIFLYGTDILIVLLFSLWIFNWLESALSKRKRIEGTKQDVKNAKQNRFFNFYCWNLFHIFKKPDFLLLLFVALAGVSILFASYQIIGIYRFIKLLEFVFLFFYTAGILKNISFSKFAFIFSLAGILQGLLAMAQFAFQRSLGLSIFGEPYLLAGRQEVAEFVAFGARFIRAYGTFSSPNVLAAFLGLAFLFLITWFLMNKDFERKHIFFVWAGTVIIGMGLILTFSRAVIFAFLLAFFVYLFVILFSKHSAHLRKSVFFALAPVASSVFFFTLIFWPEVYSRVFTTFARGDFAVKERIFFNKISFQIIQENIWGVGIGNYTFFLRDVFSGLRDQLYQPVHNIFLLMAAELGVLASAVFLIFSVWIFLSAVKSYQKNRSIKGIFYISAILFIIVGGLFDHFYITIQQGGLMFWILLGASYYYVKSKE